MTTTTTTPPIEICELCDGSGWKPLTQNGIRRVTRCDCWLARQARAADGTPMEFRDALLENFESRTGNAHALKVARAWAPSGRDLAFIGPVGTGKTRLACSLLNEHFRRHRDGLFIRVPMLLLELRRQEFAAPEDQDTALFDRCCQVSALVLDDVGVEKGSDYTRRTLQTIYDARGDQGLRTIWTSNLTLEELSVFLGDDRLPSRIFGRADVVELAGEDWRAQQRDRWSRE